MDPNNGGNNVGINKENPQARLHVNPGGASCEGTLLIDTYKGDDSGVDEPGGEEPDMGEGGAANDYCPTPFALKVQRHQALGQLTTTALLHSGGSLILGSGLEDYSSRNTFLSARNSIGACRNTTEYIKMGYLPTGQVSTFKPQFIWKNANTTDPDSDLIFSFDEPDAIDYKEVLRMTPTGMVGINTSDMEGDYSLYVGGEILAEELTVKLQQDWPDYVFAPGYVRMPLQEVEKYIEENGHLPGVPSAEEVAKDGVHVGEMNALLLQKVEELTLELIEMKEEVEQLQDKGKKQ